MKRTSFCPTSSTRTARNGRARRASGFTLIEVIVALALFAVLMVVVFVPLTQATRFMSVGRTRSELQQAANATMSQLQRDLSRAIYIYPNDNLPGITDKLPYSATLGTSLPPYYRGTVRNATTGNTSRIDMLLPEIDSLGNVKYPLTPAKYIVTYYARRFTIGSSAIGSPSNPIASAYDNPVVLIRAQYPYTDRYSRPLTAPPLTTPPSAPINVSSGRFSGADNDWITQGKTNLYSDEFDLTPFCQDQAIVPTPAPTPPVPALTELIPASHSVVTPRNVALVTPTVVVPAANSLSPNTTFTCADTNGDGKINQVTVSLTLTNFNRQVSGDGGNDSTKPVEGNLNFQKFTLMQTIDCPNVH